MRDMNGSETISQSLEQRVDRLTLLLGRSREGTGVSDVLAEIRDLFQMFQAAEARHVRVALADPTFAFGPVQERLGFLRRTFGAITRVTAEGLDARLAPAERAELERIAFLAEVAPLTSVEDLAAMRVARSSPRRREAAAARVRDHVA